MAKKKATLLLVIKTAGQKALGAIKTGLGGIVKAVGLAGAATVAFVGKSLVAYREQELAINQLNQSLINQGIFTKDLSQKYQDMASSLQKVTTFGDEQIIASQAILQSYLGQKEITQELMKATLDFAAAQGVDLKTASGLVGKAIGSSTNALTRYGVELEAGLTSTQKLSAVTDGLTQKFGGQAEAAAGGMGVIIQFKNAFGDIMETVGEKFSPLITGVTKNMLRFTERLQGSKDALSALTGFVEFTIGSFISLKNFVAIVGQSLGSVLGSTFGAMTQALEGNFRQAFETIKSGMADTGADITAQLAIQNEEINEIRDQQQVLDEERRARDVENLRASEKAKLDIEKKSIAESEVNTTTSRKKKLDDDFKADKKERLRKLGLANFDAMLKSQQVRDAQSVFSQIETLSSSNSKTLMAIGKAAGIANAMINTARGVTLALATFPAPFSFAIAGAVAAAGAAQIATISGVQLAEGGIVPSTPGGIQATIGEGSRAEMVLPLPDDFDPEEGIGGGSGGGNVYNFNGPVTVDRDFIKEIDEGLLDLRRDGDSLAFEEDFT